MRDLGYPAEPVVLNDNFLTIDHLCARQELALWQPSAVNYTYLPSNSTLNPFWDAELVGGFWKYENVVVDQASRSIAAWWGAGDSAKGQQSGQELYKALLKEKLEKVGFNPKASRVISEKCIKVERKSCVERSRTTRFNLLRIVAADSVMFSGMALVFIGLAGSVFFSPLCWVYTRSLGRLWKWVRHGH